MNEHGTCAAATTPGDAFNSAFAAYESARAAFVEAAPDAKQFALPDGAYDLMCKASVALDAMLTIEAPSINALFLKLQAMATCPFPWSLDLHEYTDRLTADAGTLSLQFAKVWLERWVGHGASAYVDQCQGGQLACFKPEFFLSTDSAALEERQKAAGMDLSDDQRSWHAAYYDGQMNELCDMLDVLPGAREAVKAIVAETPAAGLPETVGEGAR